MFSFMRTHLQRELKAIKEGGLYKAERIITSPQHASIQDQGGKSVLNFYISAQG